MFGDVLCVYCSIGREVRTSIGVHIEAWALRNRIGKREKVTDGTFTFVAIDAMGAQSSCRRDRGRFPGVGESQNRENEF
jgi:acyl-CoA hydrolase